MEIYCRLCAEPKSPDKQLNLQSDLEKHREIYSKLKFLNAAYVDVTNRDYVCFVCYDSLNKAYEFLDKVRQAQAVYNKGLIEVAGANQVCSEDDLQDDFDDFVPVDHDRPIRDLKPLQCLKEIAEQSKSDCFIETVKTEVKEEKNLSEESSNESFQDNLDVQDILDAALCNGPLQIYGKEIDKVITSWNDYQWICAYCNIEFLDINTLRSHAKIVHMKCAAFACCDCKLNTNKFHFSLFIKHVKKHRSYLRKFCHICNEKLPSTDDLSQHIKQHLMKKVPCELCGEIFSNEDSLQDHISNYSRSQKRKPRRKRGTPVTVDDLTCKICNNVYKNLNSLRDHVKRHTKDRKRDYTCEKCGKMFFNKGALVSHIMVHDQIKPHKCRICNKSFLFPNMLRRHVETHTGIKPFSCEQCGRCFRLSYQLNAHKIIHTDSMPYVCQYCSKAFRFKQLLKNHERQHTGDKPYSCQICTMEFTNWSNYNKHMKRRHNMDTSKKKITPEGVFSRDPATGEIVCDDVSEEWKSSVMIPGKRGKKKKIKVEMPEELSL